MRQIGHLAAAGLVAVETMVSRLSDDHANARRLAEIAARARGASLTPPETNILFVNFDSPCAQKLGDDLLAVGVKVSVMGESALRFVTHKDVSLEDCETAGAALVKSSEGH